MAIAIKFEKATNGAAQIAVVTPAVVRMRPCTWQGKGRQNMKLQNWKTSIPLPCRIYTLHRYHLLLPNIFYKYIVLILIRIISFLAFKKVFQIFWLIRRTPSLSDFFQDAQKCTSIHQSGNMLKKHHWLIYLIPIIKLIWTWQNEFWINSNNYNLRKFAHA